MKLRSAVVLFALLSAGCDSANGPSGGGVDNFRANIDNVPWTPSIAVTAINPAPGLYTITAIRAAGSNPYTMVISLYNITGPGTYPLGVVTNVFGGSANLSTAPSSGWTTPLNGVAGELVITTLTPTRMAGTFRFDTEPILPGSPGNPKVTNGEFDIPISGTGGVALPNQGSKVTGTIGTAFAASAVSGSITNAGGTNPVLTITASNGTRSMTLSISNMTGTGIYNLTATPPARTLHVSGAPGNLFATWSSQGSGGTGSVMVTSVTVSRVVGSFTGTLVPLAGGASGNLTVSGSFDIGRSF